MSLDNQFIACFSDDEGVSLEFTQRRLYNIFAEDRYSVVDYTLFEHLPDLLAPNREKTVTGILLSHQEIFDFLVAENYNAMKSILDLGEGVHSVDRSKLVNTIDTYHALAEGSLRITQGEAYPRVRLVLLLRDHIKKRAPHILDFLVRKITEALKRKGEDIAKRNTKECLLYIICTMSAVVDIHKRKPLTEHYFQMFDERFSLRRLMYLWTLVAYLASWSQAEKARIILRQRLHELKTM